MLPTPFAIALTVREDPEVANESSPSGQIALCSSGKTGPNSAGALVTVKSLSENVGPFDDEPLACRSDESSARPAEKLGEKSDPLDDLSVHLALPRIRRLLDDCVMLR